MAHWLGECRGAWCLLAFFLLWIGAPQSAAEPIIHATPWHGRQPSAPHNAPAGIPIWRMITLGAHTGVEAYRDALDAAGVKVGVSADEIVGRPAFAYATMTLGVELAIVSVAELGLEAEASAQSEIYARAKRIGLELCPAEVGPRLRLDYRDQPLGEALDVAMEPVANVQRRAHDPCAGELRQRSCAHRQQRTIRRDGAPHPSLRVCASRQGAFGGEARYRTCHSLTRAAVIA